MQKEIFQCMNDWIKEVENELILLHYDVLENKGKISHKKSLEKAMKEYEKYRIIQDKNYISDFDKLILETKEIENK